MTIMRGDAKPIERPKCETCPHWGHFGGTSDYGYCFRYPPTPLMLGSQLSSQTPTLDRDDGCGEHPDFPEYLKAIRCREAQKQAIPFLGPKV